MTVDAWSPTPAELSFTWDLAREADTLRITWSVENRSAETAWIAHRMVQTSQGAARLMDRPVVRTSGRPHTALIAIGLVPPDVTLMHLQAPTYRSVAPGAKLEGVATAALPLESWHPAGRVDALDETSAVIFALDGFLGEPASWRKGTDGGGDEFQTPVYSSRHWLWTEAKPLPK